MNSWRWNELEEDALAELPHEAQILYLRVIRKHMDYASGITGEKRRISYLQMQEVLSYQPPRHSREKPVEYSRDQIKRLIQKLVDTGLIERRHHTEKGVAPMAFFLPLACCDVDQHRHESATATPPHDNPHGRASGEDNTATRAPHKNEQHRHPSGSGINPSSPYGEDVAASAPETNKPKSRKKWGEEIDHELVSEMHAAVTRDLTNPKKPNVNAWANDFRLMRSVDGRTVEQIRYLITWTAEHHFWSTVILCPAKMRAKWDQLEKQVKQLKESRHANRQGTDQQRAERDRIAARLADPNDSGWIDGLFDEEEPARDAGEPDFYSAGSDLSPDMANGVQHGTDADSGQAGSGYIDGEVVGTAYESGCGYGGRADQERGRRVAPERGETGQEPAAATGGLWHA